MRVIERIEVTYKVVTPMFSGGANPAEAAEVRLPSFKGVLRWWWRALAWSFYGGDLATIHKEEADLFGSAERGQGQVVMRLLPIGPKAPAPPPASFGGGARYLGYGVMPTSTTGALTRPCVSAPLEITVELRCRDVHERSRDLLADALRAVGIFGGMGGKSRKGYGSLVLQSMKVGDGAAIRGPTAPTELAKVIEELLARVGLRGGEHHALPPYTALSAKTRVVVAWGSGSQSPDTPLALLDRVGREMMHFRSWGKDGRVLNVDSERNFKHDHDLMKAPLAQRASHPERVVFGLPHNYGKPSSQQVGAVDLDRRASPLLVHIHECASTPVAILSFLPAQFLPANTQINVGGARVPVASDESLWRPIHGFLERFLNREQRAKNRRFTDAIEVCL